MSKYPNIDILNLMGERVTNIRSKKAIDLAVSLFKAIEEAEGDDISSINDILDQWTTARMQGIDINNYRLNLKLYKESGSQGVVLANIVTPDSKDWEKGLSPLHFLIWCLQEIPATNQDEILFSLLMHGSKVEGWALTESLVGALEEIQMYCDEPEEIEVLKNMINYLKMAETLTKKIRKKKTKKKRKKPQMKAGKKQQKKKKKTKKS